MSWTRTHHFKPRFTLKTNQKRNILHILRNKSIGKGKKKKKKKKKVK